MNPQVLCQYTLSPRSPCVSLVGPSGSKYADRDTILPAVCVCVLVSDVIYVTHTWLQFDVRYISHLMSHAAHISRFVLCQLRALSNPAKLLFCIFMLNYSNHRTAVCIANMPTARSALYSIFAAKYSAYYLV